MGLRQLVLALIAPIAVLYPLDPFVASAQTQTVPAAVMKPVPEWYMRGVAAALLDPTPGVLVAVTNLEGIDEGLRAIARTAQLAEIRSGIVRKLLGVLEKDDNEERSAAAAALGVLNPSDPKQLRAVVVAFMRFASRDRCRALPFSATLRFLASYNWIETTEPQIGGHT
jgi:hypothetical protein